MQYRTLGKTGVKVSTYCLDAIGDDPNQQVNSRRRLIREMEASLRRLQVGQWMSACPTPPTMSRHRSAK